MKSKGSGPTVKEDVTLYTYRRLKPYELYGIQSSTEFSSSHWVLFMFENPKLSCKSRLITAEGLGIVFHTTE